MRRQDATLAELTRDLSLFPQKLINVRVDRGFDWQQHDGLKQASAEVQATLGSDGRILIRPSGTEPLLRVMVEARSRELAESCAKRIADALS
jgi:phosphoglucosamine mutase